MAAGTPVSFNDFNMQTDATNGFIVTDVGDDKSPDITLMDYNLARRDGQKAVSSFYAGKTIPVKGYIKSVTASGLEGLIDQLKLNLYPKAEGNLDITKGLGKRRYKSFVKSLSITRDGFQTTMAMFEAAFQCERAFGEEPTYTAMTSFSGVSASTFTVPVLTSGTAPYTPYIQLKVNTASQLGNIAMRNLATGDPISFARRFSAGEILNIDVEKQSANILGSGVTFSGIMPTFVAVSGVNPLQIISASGTQNYDVSIYFKPKYL